LYYIIKGLQGYRVIRGTSTVVIQHTNRWCHSVKVEALSRNRISDFVAYCRKHKMEVDDSFLYDKDLETFEPNEENPTYIVTDQQGKIIATASIIINDYYLRGKQGRFRIFHSEINDMSCYKMLFKPLLKHTENLSEIFIYIPTTNDTLIKSLEQLHFLKERYAFLLLREDLPVPSYQIPKDYCFDTFQPGRDEAIWCEIRNVAFAQLKGSQTPITVEMVAKYNLNADYIDGGMRILFHKEKPVGIIRGSKDEFVGKPAMNIGPVALIPEYQSKGLGRLLLREALQIAKENAYERTVLSVNGENERAKALYIQEGFVEVESVVCYQYFI
jgi:mycothiol synthase